MAAAVRSSLSPSEVLAPHSKAIYEVVCDLEVMHHSSGEFRAVTIKKFNIRYGE